MLTMITIFVDTFQFEYSEIFDRQRESRKKEPSGFESLILLFKCKMDFFSSLNNYWFSSFSFYPFLGWRTADTRESKRRRKKFFFPLYMDFLELKVLKIAQRPNIYLCPSLRDRLSTHVRATLHFADSIRENCAWLGSRVRTLLIVHCSHRYVYAARSKNDSRGLQRDSMPRDNIEPRGRNWRAQEFFNDSYFPCSGRSGWKKKPL